MKHIFTALLIISGAATVFPQQMKIVVDKKNSPVGRYVCTNERTFTVVVQDTCEIPKAGHKIVTYCAEAGDGIVYCKDWDNADVHAAPSAESPVIGKMTPEDDGFDIYPCLGKVNVWYKIDYYGKEGYVREERVNWDGMDTF